jgi:hypothetical protein
MYPARKFRMAEANTIALRIVCSDNLRAIALRNLQTAFQQIMHIFFQIPLCFVFRKLAI